MIILEYFIKRLIDFRNKIARSKPEKYYINWEIRYEQARKLSQQEIDFFTKN